MDNGIGSALVPLKKNKEALSYLCDSHLPLYCLEEF
jgi:hypothetical protein